MKRRSNNETEEIKIVFEIENESPHNVESMWATVLGNNKFKLNNIPFYAYGVSLFDVVLAKPKYNDPRPYFVKRILSSGHSTYRLLLNDSNYRYWRKKIITKINSMNGDVEIGRIPTYLSIDLPSKELEQDFVQYILELKSAKIIKDWEEANVSIIRKYNSL